MVMYNLALLIEVGDEGLTRTFKQKDGEGLQYSNEGLQIVVSIRQNLSKPFIETNTFTDRPE